MSVTFSHTAEPVISGWFMECGCGRWSSADFPTRDEALEKGSDHGCTDEFCAYDRALPAPRYVGVEPLSANFSNINARHLLHGLGVFEEDLLGGMSVEDFARAVALFETTAGTSDRVTVNVSGERVTVDGTFAEFPSARVMECGRDAGYDERALSALREVVAQAQDLHADEITWG